MDESTPESFLQTSDEVAFGDSSNGVPSYFIFPLFNVSVIDPFFLVYQTYCIPVNTGHVPDIAIVPSPGIDYHFIDAYMPD
jgi:hypothetical protein